MFSVICFEMIVFCFQSRILWSTSLDRHVDVGLSNHNVGLRIISELQCKHRRAHRATTSKKTTHRATTTKIPKHTPKQMNNNSEQRENNQAYSLVGLKLI